MTTDQPGTVWSRANLVEHLQLSVDLFLRTSSFAVPGHGSTQMTLAQRGEGAVHSSGLPEGHPPPEPRMILGRQTQFNE